jgi:hypothetical protein
MVANNDKLDEGARPEVTCSYKVPEAKCEPLPELRKATLGAYIHVSSSLSSLVSKMSAGTSHISLRRPPRPRIFSMVIALLFLTLSPLASAIKFDIPAVRHPTEKCIWNHANENVLVIVTANVAPGPNQRVDVSLVDGSDHQNVYLMKRNVRGETRLAITTHAEGDLGVCFTNTIDSSKWAAA